MMKRTSLPGRCPAILLLAAMIMGSRVGATRAAELVHQDTGQKLVTISDGQGQLVLRLNYDGRCVLDQVTVRGRSVAADSGVSTGIRLDHQWFSSKDVPSPRVTAGKDSVTVSGITYGPAGCIVDETWRFTAKPDRIVWRITRKYSAEATLEDTAFPEWDFSGLSAWTGGMLDNGGVIWSKYLDKPNATYGSHFGVVTFWNSQANDCLRITPRLPADQSGAGRFSRLTNDVFAFDYSVSSEPLAPKHDLRRFLSNRSDLWAPFHVKPAEVTVEFTLQALDYAATYDRGEMAGLDGGKVRDLLNTVTRYGVIDQRLTGGNGWRSGYICLHEPFFAEMGLALDQDDYISNFSQCLDYERDHAIGPDGRVKSRWCYTAGDSMRGTFDTNGFYEAQWGWLMDSQPDFVINVAEQFNLTGDQSWLAGQKAACESALNYLMRREVGHTGLVAMMNDTYTQGKSSDWIDIIWASYENALINAQLYYALELWANAEQALDDPDRAAAYREFAGRLKTTFNKTTADGGFWDPENQWYVYWREKDGSIHGSNLVTPVNFGAIGYGLCDDPARRKAILDRMETEMRKEGLFTWPLCFFSFQKAEGPGNFPWPRYENGDLFLSWDELGVRCYAAYDPALAVKYVQKTLDRYAQDGLSFQRYLRQSQAGAGDDILAGNCMAIVGLYRDIYGLQPQPNRLYLEPHLTAALNGTKLRYELRGREYQVDLSTDGYGITSGACTLRDTHPFAGNATDDGLEYFSGANTDWSLSVSPTRHRPVVVQIETWPDAPDATREWTESSPQTGAKVMHIVKHLLPGVVYELQSNGKVIATSKADTTGQIKFTCKVGDSASQEFRMAPAAR